MRYMLDETETGKRKGPHEKLLLSFLFLLPFLLGLIPLPYIHLIEQTMHALLVKSRI